MYMSFGQQPSRGSYSTVFGGITATFNKQFNFNVVQTVHAKTLSAAVNS